MYAKIINEETKQCEVGLGTNNNFYASISMEEMEVEQDYAGNWYLAGYAPAKPEEVLAEEKERTGTGFCRIPTFACCLIFLFQQKKRNFGFFTDNICGT